MTDKKNKEEGQEKTEVELRKQLEECQKAKNEYLAAWQRERADFLNYKKKEAERIEEVAKHIAEGFVLALLPILDSFDIAEKSLSDDSKEEESVKGFLQIKKQLLDFLRSRGVEEIKTEGQKFDPDCMEAVEMVETHSQEQKSGVVIQEVQKGYKITGRVLRPAKVKVVK